MNWQRDPVIENMLGTRATIHATEEWKRVKEYLAASFAAYLGLAIEAVWEPIYEDISPTWGFAFGIKSRSPLGGPLALEWYGVIEHRSGGATDAIVLLFSQDQRTTHHDGSEYLYFEFVPTMHGQREWLRRGWQSSEFGEWDGYLSLSNVCELKRRESGRDRTDA